MIIFDFKLNYFQDILLSEHINEQLDHDVAEMYHKTVLGRIKLSDFDG